MTLFIAALWRILLRAAPTASLQEAMVGRDGVTARFLMPDEEMTLSLRGVCWVTVNED